MTKNANLQIWKNAIPLDEAWEFFATREERAALAEMPGFIETLNSKIPGAANLGNLFASVTSGAKAGSARRDTITALREKLLDRLYDGALAAIAYREAPTRSSFPGHIDRDFFNDADMEWERDSAEAFGKRFNRIRVYDPMTLPVGAKPKIGRRGSAAAINAALDQIMRDNPNFCILLRKEQCTLICDFLGISAISGNGLSLGNLSKYILQRCPKRRIKL